MSTIKQILHLILIPFKIIYAILYLLFFELILIPTKEGARIILKEELKRDKKKQESLRLLLQEKEQEKEIEALKEIEKKYSYLVSYRRKIIGSKELVFFDITTKEEPVLISYNHYNDIMGEHISLYLYKTDDNQYGPNTKIFGRVHMLYGRDSKIRINRHTIVDLKREKCKYLYIQNFVSSVKKEGYGSTLLDFLFKICKELKIDFIIGELAYTDKENFFYTIPFYKKKGFEIYLSGDEQEGAIVKYIDF